MINKIIKRFLSQISKNYNISKLYRENIMESKLLNKEIIKDDLNIHKIELPLVLISQLTRSGGTLLSQLFDGHPECYTHPDEVKLNRYSKFEWPVFNKKKNIFKTIYSPRLHQLSKTGFHKGKKNTQRIKFRYSLFHQSYIFNKQVIFNKSFSDRFIFNNYFSSFFSSWTNYKNSKMKKKFLIGFWPMLFEKMHNIDYFYKAYPDGIIISIFRDPIGWYYSAKNHKTTSKWFSNIDEASRLWNNYYKAIINKHKDSPNNVIIIKFEDLVTDTENLMKKISKCLKIRYHPIMLKPTFNKELIESNSSFKTSLGIDKKIINRPIDLRENEINFLKKKTKSTYKRLSQIKTL